MNKIIIVAVTFFACLTSALSQSVPQKINYQAVAHDANGGVLMNQPLNVTIGVLSGSATGTLVYEESHNVSTNEYGLFYLKIGEGSVNIGAMNAISWGGADHFLSVNVNGDDLGTTQLVSVPYALVSKNTNGINGNGISNATVNDGDVLVFNGTSGQWESQPIATGETTTTIVDNGNGTFTYTNEVGTPITFDANLNDADADPINEIQDLQLNGDSLYITNNGSATAIDLGAYRDLPGSATLGDILTWNGSAWVAGIDQVDDLDNDPTNEIELPLSATSGDVLTWNGSAWVAGIDQVDDLDNDPLNELITSFTTNVTKDSIFLQDAGGVYAVGLNSGELSRINDADDNTFVETEQTINDDIIRFGQGGTEFFNMQNGHLNVQNTGGSVFIGQGAGINDDMILTDNVFVGKVAGNANTSGNKNVGTGAESLLNNTTGYGNTASGYQSLMNNTTGGENTALGNGALVNNTTAQQNTAVGNGALGSNNVGFGNTAVGLNALSLNTDGSGNVAHGYGAGSAITVGSNENLFLGYNANSSISTISNSAAIGANAVVDTDNSMVLGNNVNVGIGTSSPANKLEVVGDAAKFDSVIIVNGANAGYVLTSDASGSASWQVPTTPATFWSGSLGNIYPTTLTDNVGIGTTSPVSELDVMGNARLNDGKLMLGPVGGVNSGYTGVYEDAGDLKLAVFSGGAPTTNFGTNSIDAVTINSGNAYVGVGTTNPQANFNVVGADPSHVARFENSNNAGSSSMIFADDLGTEQFYLGFANTGYSSLWNGHAYMNTNQDFVFAKNNGERMRLGSGGFGIGTNAPDATLDVVGTMQYVDGNEAVGKVLTSDATGNVSWQVASTPSVQRINDADDNTYIETEQTTNDDVIRFGQGGTEFFNMTNGRLNINNTGASVFIGNNAGLNDDYSFNQNVGIGDGALSQNTDGFTSVAIGNGALQSQTIEEGNTAVGSLTLQSATGYYNTAIGERALYFSTTGNDNFAGGTTSMFNNTTGGGNVGVGRSTLNGNTTGSNNTATGSYSGLTNTIGNFNTFVGSYADASLNNLTNATAIGAYSFVSQDNSLVLGTVNGQNGATSNTDVGIGTSAPEDDFHIERNGNQAAQIIRTIHNSSSTVLKLDRANNGETILSSTNSIGTIFARGYDGSNYSAAASIVFLMDGNPSVGDTPGKIQFRTSADGTNSPAVRMTIKNDGDIGIGTGTPAAKLDIAGDIKITDGTEGAGKVLTSDAAGLASWQDVSGWSTLGNVGTIDGVNFIGTTDNVPLGLRVNNAHAGKIDVTLRNTSFGGLAANILSTGQRNSAFGDWALRQTSSGTNNTAIGVESMFNNTTGSNNTSIGTYSGVSSGALNNSTAIGYNTLVNASNKVRIGDPSVTVIEGQVAYSFPSDGRFKTNIKSEEVHGLDFIMKLNPVVYNFDTKKYQEFLLGDLKSDKNVNDIDYAPSTAIRQSGFIAQEVEASMKEIGYDFNGVHKPESEKDNYSVSYQLFVVPMVKAMQEQQAMIEDLIIKQRELELELKALRKE